MPCDVVALRNAISEASKRLRALRGTYPGLDPYLVIATRTSQQGVDETPSSLLRNLRDAFVDDAARREGLSILAKTKEIEARLEQGARGADRAEAGRLELASLVAAWTALEPSLRLQEDLRLELRFGRLLYPLIWKLQQDPLVDRELTPQTEASIRIVMGTIAALGGHV